MQDRYTGDIGDFGKLGLLRSLANEGLSVGVNWYLTPDETHNGDGRHIGYLSQDEFRACDEVLWNELERIVKVDRREVRSLESSRILRASFFSDRLDFTGRSKRERSELRDEWFTRSLAKLAGLDVVFVDPDNGLVAPSAMSRPRENKFVLRDELAAYYAKGSTVVYYQHKARRKDDFYTRQLDMLATSADFPGATGIALKFRTTSQRYYMFLVRPEHMEKVDKAIVHMLSSAWVDHFRLVR